MHLNSRFLEIERREKEEAITRNYSIPQLVRDRHNLLKCVWMLIYWEHNMRVDLNNVYAEKTLMQEWIDHGTVNGKLIEKKDVDRAVIMATPICTDQKISFESEEDYEYDDDES